MRLIMMWVCSSTLLFSAGCATVKPYAQNPYNLTAKLEAISPQNPGKLSDSTGFRAAGVGLAAASTPLSGGLSQGASVGIASTLLAASILKVQLNRPRFMNYLNAYMPLTYASDEDDAQIKMGSLVESAIVQALQPAYQTKIEEYDDHYWFSRTLRPRWIRVNGPLCENWTCQVVAPIPTRNALQWEGEMDIGKQNGQKRYTYIYGGTYANIGFVKIIEESDKNAHHVVKGVEIPQFDYHDFYTRISEHLPEWVVFYVSSLGEPRYKLVKGVKSPVQIN